MGSVEELKKVDTFALGGVGYSGRMSEGEEALHEIMKGGDALNTLVRIIQDPETSRPGKLYAALGIRWIDQRRGEEEIKPLLASKQMVSRMAGCAGFEEQMSEVASQVNMGKYDWSRGR